MSNSISQIRIGPEGSFNGPDDGEISGDKFASMRYKPIELLGSGSNAAVYLARDEVLKKQVAVKILHAALPEQLVSFQDEARATGKLKHRSIINLLDFSVSDDGAPYMVLEHFNGLTLFEELRRNGPLDWPSCQQIFLELCEALQHSHDNDVFHRDIKPENILLDFHNDSYKVRIIDFGLAKITNSNRRPNPPGTCTLAGTPLYLSPDAVLGKTYDARSEVYSLGCVLFEALTGQTPFDAETALELLALHTNRPAPKLRECSDLEYPPELEDLVAKALSKNPDDRFQSMAEFAAALRQIECDPTHEEMDHERQPNCPVRYGRLAVLLLIALTLLAWGTFTLRDSLKNLSLDNVCRSTAISYEKNEGNGVLTFKDLMTLVEPVRADTRKGAWQTSTSNHHEYCVEGSDVTDDDFKRLSNYPPIDCLTVTTNSPATGRGCSYLAKHPLSLLEMRSRNFDDDGALSVSKLNGIKTLAIRFADKLTLRGIVHLSALPKLEHLQLLDIANLPRGTALALSKSKTLTKLNLRRSSPISLTDMRTLNKCPALKSLQLEGTNVDDEFMLVLSKSKLTELEIADTSVTDKGLLNLVTLATLKKIRISYPEGPITRAGLERFQAFRPDCTVDKDPHLTRFAIGNLGPGQSYVHEDCTTIARESL